MNQDKQVLEALVAGRAIISQVDYWIKGKYAARKNGDLADWDSPEAECFCSLGALRRATMYNPEYGELIYSAAREALNVIVKKSNTVFVGGNGVSAQCRGIVMFNDTQDHESVMGIWDTTINDLKNRIGE